MKWNRTHTAVLILMIGLSFLLAIGMYYLFLNESLDHYDEVSLEREKQKNVIANQAQFDIEDDVTLFQQLPVEPNHKEILTILETEAVKTNIQISEIAKSDATVPVEPPEGIEVSTFSLSFLGETEHAIISFMKSMELNQRIFSISEAAITKIDDQRWQGSFLLHSYYYPNSKKLKTYLENSPF